MNMKVGKLAAAALSACLLTAQSAQAVEFGAFGNVNLEKIENQAGTFALGGFDLFARQDISDKSSALVEYVIESGDGTSFVLDLERLTVDYEFGRALTVSAGRIHSKAGYWNTAYHHGQFLQPTIARPEFLEFEDGKGADFPMHLIGLFADGELSSAAGVFKYHGAWANNPQIDKTVAANDREILLTMNSDVQSNKTIAGKISFEPDRTPIQIGIYGQSSTYNSTSGSTPAGRPQLDQSILGVDLHANLGNLEFLTEYYSISNDDRVGTAGSHDVTDWFVQAGYSIAEVFTPTVRYESSNGDDSTDVFRNGTLFSRDGYTKWVGALRYDVDESNAVTIEYSNRNSDVNGIADVNALELQWSFMVF
ncbi:MAG: hypothetical protein D6698_01980 [Gammaproteobacteria bacterium]|nr:MAG: hypothetical protein D6698_01980 [Gammaproteobacteria bacterium]